jgi:LPS export ABC transporter protein LptC
MKERESTPRGALALVTAVLLAVGLAGCEEPVNAPSASAELIEMGADNVAFGMVSFMTSNGIREGRVEADTAYMFADSSMAKLRRMKIVFYNENGTERAVVTGDRGEWNQNTDRMVAHGNVVLIVHEDGRKIESEELNYDPTQRRIWSDSATVQTMADGSVTRGSAFQSDMEFKNVRIENIRGRVGRIF